MSGKAVFCMFIYNTTFVINISKFSEWKEWLNAVYPPAVKTIVSACESGVYEVMTQNNKTERTTSVQWKVVTPADLDEINRQSLIVLGQMQSTFGQDVLFFSTILKSL